MKVPRTIIDQYLEKMLLLQYSASEFIEHKLTKGELREKFIVQMVKAEIGNLSIHRGILSQDDWQSGQCDFIHLRKDARIGNMNVYDVEDCLIFMEIKSNAKKAEFDALENTALQIKARNAKVKVGMLCYCTQAKEQTVIKKFGFSYDRELQAYEPYNDSLDIYRNIDFIYSLNYNGQEETTPYYIVKDINQKKVLFKQTPVIGKFLLLFRTNDN